MEYKVRNIKISSNQREEFWRDVEQNKWESFSFDLLDKYIKKDKLFIDIGAWNGVLSLYSAKLGARVISFEPDIVAYNELKDNILLNKDIAENIKYSMKAISNKNGFAYISNITEGFGNSMSSLINRENSKKGNKVECITLPKFITDNNINPSDICLIKIDTEGGEALIIPQCREFLKKYKPVIYLSLHSFWFPDRENDIKITEEVIYETYDVSDIRNGGIVLQANFEQRMKQYTCDEFILTPKI